MMTPHYRKLSVRALSSLLCLVFLSVAGCGDGPSAFDRTCASLKAGMTSDQVDGLFAKFVKAQAFKGEDASWDAPVTTKFVPAAKCTRSTIYAERQVGTLGWPATCRVYFGTEEKVIGYHLTHPLSRARKRSLKRMGARRVERSEEGVLSDRGLGCCCRRFLSRPGW